VNNLINKRNLHLLLFSAGAALGLIGAFSSLKVAFAAAAALFVFALILLDYQKVTYAVGLYLVIDYLVRNVSSLSFLSSIWDELLFVFCVMIWFYKWLIHRKEKAYIWTPIEFPLIFFVGICIFSLLVNTPNFQIGVEGLRVVIQYTFWYFVIVQLLKTPSGAKKLLYLLVFTGAALALHGIYQYIIAIQMPTGWVDRVEQGIRTRVFSIIGSPNILGSLMVLLIPVSISFVIFEKKIFKKILFGCFAVIMTACLVFTHSRGAEISFIVAIAVFVLMFRDRRITIPAICAFIISIVLVGILVPTVIDRMLYMLSPEYMASSLKGGRMIRWLTGLEMLKGNLWLGVGLGHFGGAVAMNNDIPGTFYMDNYFLKTAVEMGLVGLTAFIILIYNALVWPLRTLFQMGRTRYSYIVQGLFAGMCGVTAHNLVENVFEVPMMVTYFWLFAGVAMFLGYKHSELQQKELVNSKAPPC